MTDRDFGNRVYTLRKNAGLSQNELEIERKFLIEYPDVKLLEADPACRRIEIIQTYLKSDNGDEVRVRQRGENGNYVDFLTTKRKLCGIKRIEIEKRLTKEEYLALLMDISEQAMIDKHTGKLLSYRLGQQHCCHRRVHTAGQSA